MKRTVSAISILVVTFILVGCDLLRDRPFQVVAWLPRDFYQSSDGAITVSLTFSYDPNKVSVENAFTLREDGENVKGNFSWSGRTVRFVPIAPLVKNRNYEISVGTDARTEDGLSLEERFEAQFSTRLESEIPRIVDVYPSDGALVSDMWSKVRIRFSCAVELLSCVNEISFLPSSKGVWSLEEDGRLAVWTPLEQWKTAKEYRLIVSRYFENAAGKSAGKQHEIRWKTGEDNEGPQLLCAASVDKNGFERELIAGNDDGFFPFDVVPENAGWESSYKLKLDWNEPVDVSKARNSFSIEPQRNFNIEPAFGFSRTVFISLDEAPEWDSRFNFKLNSGITDKDGNQSLSRHFYRVRTNGPQSMPPKLAGIRVPVNPKNIDSGGCTYSIFPSNAMFEILPIDANEFDYNKNTKYWMELYFVTAVDAKVDVLSLMDLFRVQASNNALSFSATAMSDTVFTELQPALEFSGKNRVEVRGNLYNSAASGVVVVSVGKGLRDTAGNKMPSEMKIQFVK